MAFDNIFELGLEVNPLGSGDNAPGIANHAFVIDKTQIATFAQLPSTVTNLEDINTLTGNHTLEATKFWEKVFITEGTGSYGAEMYGQPDGNGFNVTAMELFRPGTGDENLAFMTYLKNKSLVAMVKNVNCTDTAYFQIGTECLGARVTSMKLDTFNSDGEDRAGVVFTISCRQGRPLKYTGTLATE
jgi:hypothetical protein